MGVKKKQDWRSRVSVMLSLLVAWLLAVLWAWPAFADIGHPSFKALVEGAETIVVGTVTFIYPAPLYWLPLLVFGLGIAVVGTLLMQSHRKGLKTAVITAACFFLLGLVLAFMVGPGFRGYRWVAVLSASEVLKGSNESKRLHIHYPGHTICDMSRFEMGKRYVVFVRHSDNWYPLLGRPRLVPYRYDWGIWEVTPQGVTTKRLQWDDIPPKPLEEFKTGIRCLLADPTHADYARIRGYRNGVPNYYPIRYDPFFNPSARAKLDEEQESTEGDAR